MSEFNFDDIFSDLESSNAKYFEQDRIREDNVANSGNLVRGVKSGTDQLQGSLYGAVGLAGDALGVDTVRDWGFKGYQENMEEASLNPTDVQNFTDINTDDGILEAVTDTGKWFAGAIGQLAPSMAMSLVSSLVGVAAGGAAAGPLGATGGGIGGLFGKKLALKKIDDAVASHVAAGMTKELAERTVKDRVIKIAAAQKIGSGVGIVESTAAMEGGGMWGEAAEKYGVENANAGSAFGLAQVSGLSELYSPGGWLVQRLSGVKSVGNEVVNKVADTFLKRLGTEVPKSMGQEAAQEVFQSFLGILNKKVQDPTVNITDRENIYEMLNSGAAGAAGGLVFGGVSAIAPERPKENHTVDDVLNEHSAKVAVGSAIAKQELMAGAAQQPNMAANTVGGVLGETGVTGQDSLSVSPRDDGAFQRIVPPAEVTGNLPDLPSEAPAEIQQPDMADVKRLGPHLREMWGSIGQGTNPDFVKLKTLKDWEKQTGEPVKSYVSSTSAKETLLAVGNGEPLTEKQAKVWSYLKSVAENKAMIAEQGTGEFPADFGMETAGAKRGGNQGVKRGKNQGKNQGVKRGVKGGGDLQPAPRTIVDPETGETFDIDTGEIVAPAEPEGEPAPPIPNAERHEIIENTESVAAGQVVNTAPSESQAEAGNYKKGHVKLDGMDISIENPAGSTRRGTDESGTTWETEMKSDYGYVKGTTGYDKDHVDVFLSPGYQGGGDTAFIVDQYNSDGSFDEHKVVLGAASASDAMATYNSNYAPGWDAGKSVTPMAMEDFKAWAKSDAPKAGPVDSSNALVDHTSGQIAKQITPIISKHPVKSSATEAEKETNSGTNRDTKTAQVTQKNGKVIKGIVRKGITLDEAKAIDKYTFPKDGGFFIREKYLSDGENASTGTDQTSENTTPEQKQPVTTKEEDVTEPKSEQAAEPVNTKNQFANNKLFTADAVQAARERLKAKRNSLNTGLDPELIQDMLTLGGAYFEAGIRDFATWSKTVLSDIGDEFKPFLRGTYENLRYYPGLDTEGITAHADIETIPSGKEDKPTDTKATALEAAKQELKNIDDEIEHLYKLRECLSS